MIKFFYLILEYTLLGQAFKRVKIKSGNVSSVPEESFFFEQRDKIFIIALKHEVISLTLSIGVIKLSILIKS